MSELNALKQELFNSENGPIADIKLYPGFDRNTTPEDAARAIRASLKAIKEGRYKPVDLNK